MGFAVLFSAIVEVLLVESLVYGEFLRQFLASDDPLVRPPYVFLTSPSEWRAAS